MKIPITLGYLLYSSIALSQHDSHDHSQMQKAEVQEAGEHDHSKMHHGDTKVPDDARDPHEYSNGYTALSHPYLQADMPEHAHSGDHLFWALIVDRFEVAATQDAKPVPQLEAQAWVGSSFKKILVRTEAEFEDSKVSESENELLWSQAIGPYFDSVVGLRYDAGTSEGQGYGTIGVRGLMPYWFETSANLYVGDQGRIAIKAEAEYDLLFTQRLILSPSLELDLKDLAGQNDEDGLHSRKAKLGFRLRYEIYRRFAPYIGTEFVRYFGESPKDAPHEDTTLVSAVAGVKFWF